MSRALADRGDHETVLGGAVVDPQDGAVHGLLIVYISQCSSCTYVAIDALKLRHLVKRRFATQTVW
jgi:hypothetical protein